jgi:hypothetical protein
MSNFNKQEICYKSCDNYLLTLQKLHDTITNESRSDVSDSRYAKFRANKLKVIRIEDKDSGKQIDSVENSCYQQSKILYQINKTVVVPDYNLDLDVICTTGVHYFKDREVAWQWQKEIVTGKKTNWYANGQKMKEGTYINGKLEGNYTMWHDNGQKLSEYTYLNDVMNGSYNGWYENGQKSFECTYLNGNLAGLYKSWYDNGQKLSEYTYLNVVKQL